MNGQFVLWKGSILKGQFTFQPSIFRRWHSFQGGCLYWPPFPRRRFSRSHFERPAAIRFCTAVGRGSGRGVEMLHFLDQTVHFYGLDHGKPPWRPKDLSKDQASVLKWWITLLIHSRRFGKFSSYVFQLIMKRNSVLDHVLGILDWVFGCVFFLFLSVHFISCPTF